MLCFRENIFRFDQETKQEMIWYIYIKDMVLHTGIAVNLPVPEVGVHWHIVDINPLCLYHSSSHDISPVDRSDSWLESVQRRVQSTWIAIKPLL